MRAKYIKPRKGAKNPKWRIQYFDDEGKFLYSENGYKLKDLTQRHAENQLYELRQKQIRANSGIPQPTDRTALDLIAEYIEIKAPKGGVGGRPWNADYLEQNRFYLPWWIQKLGVTKASEITLTTVERILNALPLANGTKNKRYKFLNSWLTYCHERGYLPTNPVRGFTYFDNEVVDPRRALSLPEYGRLMAVVPYGYSVAYQMAMVTGIRSTALSKVERPDIKWDRKVVTVGRRNQKNNKAQEYPLPDWYLERLQAYLEGAPASGPIFPFLSPRHEARRLRVYLKRAKIPFRTEEGKIDFHALRVTFGTWANDTGADPKTLQELLGHSTPILSFKTYVKANADRKRAAVEEVGAKMLEAATSGTNWVHTDTGDAFDPINTGSGASGDNPLRIRTTRRTTKVMTRTTADINEIKLFVGRFLEATQPRTQAGQGRTPARYKLGTQSNPLADLATLIPRLTSQEVLALLDTARAALLARRQHVPRRARA